MAGFKNNQVYINKDSDDELLDRIRNGGNIIYSDLYPNNAHAMPSQNECIYAKPIIGRGNSKPTITLLWILEYLKTKHPEDKDAISSLIEVVMKEM